MASDDNESIALQFFGIIFAGAVLTALLSWGADKLSLAEADAAGVVNAATSTLGEQVRAVMPFLIGVGVTLVALLILAGFRRRRRRRRAAAAQVLAAAIEPLMPTDWTTSMLVITRWRGFIPRRGRLVLSPHCRDDDPRWREAVATTIKARLSATSAHLTWPAAPTKRRGPDRTVTWTVDYDGPPAQGKAAGRPAVQPTPVPPDATRRRPAVTRSATLHNDVDDRDS